MVRVTGTDPDGDAIARPVDWQGDGPPPIVLMHPERRDSPALAPGERVLARLTPIGGGKYEGRTLSRLSDEPGRILGVFRARHAGRRPGPAHRPPRQGGMAHPARRGGRRRSRRDRGRHPAAACRARPEARAHHRAARPHGRRPRGQPDLHPRARHPAGFLARGARRGRRGRAPSRSASARTCATSRSSPSTARTRAISTTRCSPSRTATGFRLLVAIADVAHYVRPGSPLDRAARTRGNSVYFPDRVVPMLPEALSNGWCSLRPDEDRGCLFAEMRIDAAGRKTAHRFGRGLMRSAARLTYTQVQEAHDRGDDARPRGPVVQSLRRVSRAASGAAGARHARPRPAGAAGRARRRARSSRSSRARGSTAIG